jgi:hypothetical protein
MATAQQDKRPATPPRPVGRLARGFASLTLDPSPHLRRSRRQAQKSSTLEQAWKDVGRAISEAIGLVANTITHHQ